MNSNSVPQEAVRIYNRALEMSSSGDFESAIIEYRRAIEIHPPFVEAYNNIGEIYSQLGKADTAMETYMEALNIRKDQKVLLNIGVEYYNREDFKEALEYFLDSVNTHRDFIEGNFYTALTYYNLENLKKSEKYFKNVIEIDQKHVKANYLLSTIYYDWKDYRNAALCLENIMDVYEDRIFINKYYGFCCYFLGKYEESVKYLTEALVNQPNYKKYKKFLNSLTYENKVKEIEDIDREIEDLERMIKNEKTNIKEFTKLSMLYIFKGKNNEAEKLLLRARRKLAS
jgi:tetratricopeptide (TPR) repeat protein